MPEISPCPLMEPPQFMTLPTVCNGQRFIDRGPGWDEGREDGVDAVVICQRCGARWTLDGKDGGFTATTLR